MQLTKKEIIEEIRRIEDKSFKFLSSIVIFWFSIIFFFLKDDLTKKLNIISILYGIFNKEYNLISNLFGIMIIIFFIIYSLKFIFELLDISITSWIINKDETEIKILERLDKYFSDTMIKVIIFSVLLPISFFLIYYLPNINSFIDNFEVYILIFYIIILYIIMPLYSFIKDKENKLIIQFFDLNSVISGSITIFILLQINLIGFHYYSLLHIILLLISISYSYKYMTKLLNPNFITNIKQINIGILLICFIYLLILLVLILLSYFL